MRLGLSVNWEQRQICIHEPIPVPKFSIRWGVTTSQATVKGDGYMAVTMKDTEKVGLAIAAVDAKGNAAKLDGVPAWAVSDPAGLALTVAPDGLSASVAAVGPVGNFQVTVAADADLGAGVRELLGILDFEIVAGEAVAITFAAGIPEPA